MAKKVNIRYPGSSANQIIREATDRKNALRCDEDTISRTEIHGIIASCLKEGKDKKYIVDVLSRNPKYEKYNMYFESWITDKMKKISTEKRHNIRLKSWDRDGKKIVSIEQEDK